MALPEKGTFKIATIGPKKEIPKKDNKNEHWTTWSLQFEQDPNWYDTFWVLDNDPEVGQELTGEKTEHEKFGLQFAIDRPGGGKRNWNPAGAQSTIVLASVEIVNGFLSLGNHYELWEKGDATLKEKFKKYVATVEVASKQLKEVALGVGSINAEEKVADKPAQNKASEPAPSTPPAIEGWPENNGEEEVDV